MEYNTNARQPQEVDCPYCKQRARIIARRGKGQFKTRYAVIGAICTISLMGVGAFAGFWDYGTKKNYIVCAHCGYDGFEKADFRQMRNIREMEFTGSLLEDFSVPIHTVAQAMCTEAKRAGIPLSIRLEQAYDPKSNDLNVMPCLIIENPHHISDYYRFCLTYHPDPMGALSGYRVFVFGRSTQMEIVARQEANYQRGNPGLSTAAFGALTGHPYMVVGSLAHESGAHLQRLLQKASDDRRFRQMAWEAEREWYAAVWGVICGRLGTGV